MSQDDTSASVATHDLWASTLWCRCIEMTLAVPNFGNDSLLFGGLRTVDLDGISGTTLTMPIVGCCCEDRPSGLGRNAALMEVSWRHLRVISNGDFCLHPEAE